MSIMEGMKFEAVLFDNDGVLIDTERRYVRACQEIVEEMFGLNLSLETYQEWGYTKGLGTGGWLATQGISEEKIAEFQRLRNLRYEEFLGDDIELMVGVREFLDFLIANDIPRAIVTATPRVHLVLAHSQTGLLDKFSFAVCNGEVSRSKPFPDGYLAAAEKLGFSPERCLVIEDSPRGVQAGKSAGMTVWAVPTVETRELDFSIADKVFAELGEGLEELKNAP